MAGQLALSVDASLARSRAIIDSVYYWSRVRDNHKAAPLLAERAIYLSHLIEMGFSRERLRSDANLLLHIIRLLSLTEARPVTTAEIQAASEKWARDEEFHVTRRPSLATAAVFRRRALSWFRFLGLLATAPLSPPPLFQDEVRAFVRDMREQRGLSLETLRGYGTRIWYFLVWYREQGQTNLAVVTVACVDAYLQSRRDAGYNPRSMAAMCQALRSFFGYAEARGWCQTGIARSIRSPRVPKYDEAPRGPTWKEVRRLLRTRPGKSASDYKAHAILALCAIYGLRASEIARLTLSDFDWVNETIVVKRSKRGKVQQFPLQYEVGEIIIAYLRHGRPQCSCRNLFVTRTAPRRPVGPATLWPIVSRHMRRLGIESQNIGPHALRHSCATQLLKKGTSLQGIADFLGHRDTKSVSIYAKYDRRSLREVAQASLRGVL